MADRSEIDLVRERIDILQVLAPYVALKRSGRVWKGLCPFHNEKTPSFTVDPDRKLWHCFGSCSEGGDAIKFLQKIENLSFPEALERLAIQSGVVLAPFQAGGRRESGQAEGAQRQPSERDRLYAATERAARFYQETLAASPDAGRYLAERAIGHEAQRDFRLGYAGEDWDSLAEYLQKNGIALPDAVRAGLLALSDRGGHYDKLRGRIIFPILDVQERVIGFGGRLMEAIEGRPKYLNSAETPLFTKGKTLYGLWRARKAIAAAEQAIVVEGYMDVIACHQAGIENVVAALGTALTEQHAQILSRYAPKVFLSFDADAAGLKAADRAAQVFAAQEIEARMLDLPEGEDPDSLLRAGRTADFLRAVETAQPVPEYHLRKILARPGLAGAPESDKIAVFRREVLPILRAAKSVMERERYIRLAAPIHPQYGVGSAYAEEQIRQEVEGKPAGQYSPSARSWNGRPFGGRYGAERRYGNDKGGGRWRGPERDARPPEPGGLIPIEAQTAEEILLRALLADNPEYIQEVAGAICPEDFPSPLYRALARRQVGAAWHGAAEEIEEADLDSLCSKLLLEAEADGAPLDPKAIKDSIAKLRKLAMKRRVEDLRVKATEGDQAAAAELLRWQQERRKL